MSSFQSAKRSASLCLIILSSMTSPVNGWTFALVPKQQNNTFFDLARDGCQARASKYSNVSCLYVGPEVEGDAKAQADIIDDLIARGDVHGISLSVTDATIATEAIERAVHAGIPVVTFDSDAPDSLRTAYVGTNNTAFGNELGKLLVQLAPQGGNYGIITASAPNVMVKGEGARDRLSDSLWEEVPYSPKDCEGDIDVFYRQMWEYAADPSVDAIIPTGAWPFLDDDTSRWIAFRDAHPNLTMVASETLPVALDLMNIGKVDGLVGQLPFQMGEMSVEALWKIHENETIDDFIPGTSFMEVLLFPLELPPVNVDMHYIGNLAILGYVMFGGIVLLSIGFAAWTFANRDTRVVRASQPMFLGLICVGTLIFSCTIVPLTIEEGQYSQQSADIACMSQPWLMSIGFTTIFAALFSKTWRINKIFHNARHFTRIKVEAKDVMLPYVGLLCVNFIVLLCWTLIAPLVYVRDFHAGTDLWNRKISSYGYCGSSSDAKGGFIPYVVIISFVNIGVLVLAIGQAYQARSIRTEYSESKYITIIMTLMLEAFVFAIPIIALVWDEPRPFFVVMVVLISVICFAVLLFMFVPKVNALREKRREKANQATREGRGPHRSRGNSGPNASFGGSGLKMAKRSSTEIARAIARPSLTSEKDDGSRGLKVRVLKSTHLSEPFVTNEDVQSLSFAEEGGVDSSGEIRPDRVNGTG